MISFNLRCDNRHEFEGWFKSSGEFAAQAGRGLVECPTCGSKAIEKALMAPAIASGRSSSEPVPVVMETGQAEAVAQLRALMQKVRENAEYVGDRFAEEARRIHYGETEARGIYGKASISDVKSLAEEGVEFMPLPTLPEDRN